MFFYFVLLESSGGRAGTPNAFIFSLNNSERLAPFVSKVKKDKAGKAINRKSDTGPVFGQDLEINLDAKFLGDSKALLGAYYSIPALVKNNFAVLAGPGKTFSPDKVEVFYLDPSMQDNTN